jgi:hypothetical protein
MASYQTSTLAMVAGALDPTAGLTPREIEGRLRSVLARTTVRAVLGILVRQGLAVAEGDIFQKRYRASALQPAGAAVLK